VERAVNVYLYKNLVFRAEGDTTDTTIGSPESDIAIYVNGVDGTGEIRGFHVETRFIVYACVDAAMQRVPDLPPETPIGIACDNSSVRIEENHIINHGAAVVLDGSPVTIRRNAIRRGAFGIYCVHHQTVVTSDSLASGPIGGIEPC
jgi:hypothetical protein